MRLFINLLIAGTLLTLPLRGAVANELINQIAIESHPSLVCEIKPRAGAARSYLIFHLIGFSDKRVLRYRAITATPVEIRTTLDGTVVSEKTPCLKPPIPFP